MAAFTAKDVMKLRELTGTGMMDCKKALIDADGDMDKAAEILREKGLAKAAKKASRIAAEGIVDSYICEKCGVGVLVEVNCETDFVAKTDNFKAIVHKIAQIIAEQDPADVTALLACSCDEGTVEEMIKNATFQIGEKIDVRRVRVMNSLFIWVKIGVLVEADKEADKEKMHDVALQIAAVKPEFIAKTDVPAATIEHEKEILKAQALNEPNPKPLNIIEKMVEGRIQKYFKEVCLLEQPFVKDGDITVSKMIGGDFNVKQFVRYEMGEGLQKREDNFAEEVMSQIGK
ncbi:MAG: translation elongation factor Ts [Lachnospiraceae bacterium]